MSIIDPTFKVIKRKSRKESIDYITYQEDWEIFPLHDIVDDGPIQLDLELNNDCNYRCIMCFQSYDTPTPAMIMPLEKVKGLIDQAVKIGVKSLKLNYRGEPLLYPFLIEVVQYAKSKGILETLINTNGSLLTPDISRYLIKAGLGKIIISIDGFLPETYAKIRRGGQLGKVTKNVLSLVSLKQLYSSDTPIVRVQMVEQEANRDELKKFTTYWSEIADEVAVEKCIDYTGLMEDSTVLPTWYCSQLWQRLFILVDGTFLPCCRAMEGGNKSLYILGKGFNIQLEKVWKGSKLNQLRKAHRDGLSHTITMCRKCGIRKEVVNHYV